MATEFREARVVEITRNPKGRTRCPERGGERQGDRTYTGLGTIARRAADSAPCPQGMLATRLLEQCELDGLEPLGGCCSDEEAWGRRKG